MSEGKRIRQPPDEADERRRMRAMRGEAVWRAQVDERLRSLESAVADIRTRQTAILTIISGAAFAQVILRLTGH